MSKHYKLVSEMMYWLIDNQQAQPGLEELSSRFGVSEYHLQKVFQKMVGISPKQFSKALNKDLALERLRRGNSALETTLDLGLSSPGRLHDLLVTTMAVTPGEVRSGGRGVTMTFGTGSSPFGATTVAWTERGVSFLGFACEHGNQDPETELFGQWPDVTFTRKEVAAQNQIDRIFSIEAVPDLRIWLRGTPFQLRVWEALLRIPADSLVSYGLLAKWIGKPNASRAIGTAIGRNPVSWLIPCHRVITSLAGPGGYRWGVPTKLAFQAIESVRSGIVT